MAVEVLDRLAPARAAGTPFGVTSVCSAHPLVIEAALLEAASRGEPALIEATCNQVNQDGGYTGLTPAAFRDDVLRIARRVGVGPGAIILGGDHLGPNPWRHLPAADAMARAETMVAAYAAAGFAKIHLDTSMGCAGEPDALPDAMVAARAARLAAVAEATAGDVVRYVIGTEVPTPGGATHPAAHVRVTRPDAVRETLAVHRAAFEAAGVGAAWSRVVAIVVQPGVEFGHSDVAVYHRPAARGLAATLDGLGVVFEAHSTDYQPADALTALVRDGFAILKVGPALTFALREAFYGLDRIAAALDPAWRDDGLEVVLERAMLADPSHWQSHYAGSPDEIAALRHRSLSDRIRYYWPVPEVRRAVAALLARLDRDLPPALLAEFLPRAHGRVADGSLPPRPEALLLAAVRDVLAVYAAACRPEA